MRRRPTPGSSRPARSCGRSSATAAAASRRATSSACATARWRYATYVWNEQGSDATLAPARGITALPVTEAPQGRYDIPARADCTSCHEGAATPVLGFSALQLSPDRDPLAAHAQAPQPRRRRPAHRSSRAGSCATCPPHCCSSRRACQPRRANERAALGYLHANCGHCHNRSGNGVPVRLTLAQSVLDGAASRADTLASAVGVAGRYRSADPTANSALIEPQAPERSVLVARMQSRQPHLQMPPLGTRITDREGLALVQRWIHHDLSPLEEQDP